MYTGYGGDGIGPRKHKTFPAAGLAVIVQAGGGMIAFMYEGAWQSLSLTGMTSES